VVSTAIIVERQEDGQAYLVQRPVYFVSEVLSESKARCQPVRKLLYAVLITSRKLRQYFQEYSITVVTDYPLGDILRNQDATGRISKWVVELGALNIDFKLHTIEGPKRRTREAGSEWEPIKILFKNSAYEPDFTRAPPQASLAKVT
jgi:hypothetical protein